MSAPHFDPTGLEPRSATDEQREAGPVARTPEGIWVVLGHDEAEDVADDDVSFSSAVSRFLQVPNGLDGDEHAAFRAATDHFFAADEMAAFEPTLRRIAKDLVWELTVDVGADGTEVDAVAAIGAVFAVRAQTAWLGWPSALETELLQWMVDNHEASRSRQLERTAEVAARFDALIRSVIEPRRAAGAYSPDDVTTRLLHQSVHLPDPEVPGSTDRALRDDEVVSILRNWTGGDLGSLALCVGVLLMALSTKPQLVHRLRVGTYEEAVAITDELLRIDSPFVSNRRVATCPVTVAGYEIAEGDRLLIHWTSANRDERTFPNPDAFDPGANAPRNLVYGTGAHVCPGRPLATLELVVALQEILAAADVSPAPTAGEREIAPVGGWASAPIVLTPRG